MRQTGSIRRRKCYTCEDEPLLPPAVAQPLFRRAPLLSMVVLADSTVVDAVGRALVTAVSMFWEVLWPLVLGFALSGAVQAVVSHRSLARLLGDDSPRSLALA